MRGIFLSYHPESRRRKLSPGKPEWSRTTVVFQPNAEQQRIYQRGPADSKSSDQCTGGQLDHSGYITKAMSFAYSTFVHDW
jgi:hypothetical protein